MQQINLYKPPPPPPEVKLPLQQVLLLAALWIAIQGGMSLFDYMDNRKIVVAIEELNTKKLAVERDLRLLKANLPQEHQEETLLKKAEDLGKIKSLREKMFYELNKLESEEQTGFANYFYALSKYAIPGIWFTKFKFFKGGKSIILEGQAKSAGLVPNLVEKLGADKAFKNKRFESLDIALDEKDETLVNFTLHSD